MKKVWTIFLFSLIAISINTSSCKKEEDNNEQAAIDQALIEDYISDNQLNAQSTSSGLHYVILKTGTSEHPTIYSTVTVSYKGYLLNGDVFDENLAFTSRLNSLIKGWQEGIPLFGKGGKGVLIVPSHLGYGTRPVGTIPANSVLEFDIELVDFD
jgi:FKBP-type peptidyl-prolyl cis-trans isomerase FkpA